MKRLLILLVFVFVLWVVMVGFLLVLVGVYFFNVYDLVMFDCVSDLQFLLDGCFVVFSLYSMDYVVNKGVNVVYVLDLYGGVMLVKVVSGGSLVCWLVDGKSLFYVVLVVGVDQLWCVDLVIGKYGVVLGMLVQVSYGLLDLGGFIFLLDGKCVVMIYEVYFDCVDLVCMKECMDGDVLDKFIGMFYKKLFVCYWDVWVIGWCNQFFVVSFDVCGQLLVEFMLVSCDIDGDVLSKLFGGMEEVVFVLDGQSVYFGVCIVGSSELWLINFDVYCVLVDGFVVLQNFIVVNFVWDVYLVLLLDGCMFYYLVMKEFGFEVDCFVIMVMDLVSGIMCEVDL